MVPGLIRMELIQVEGETAAYRYWCAKYGEGEMVISLDDDRFEVRASAMEPDSLPAAKRAMVKVRKLKLETGVWPERAQYVAY